MKSTALDNAKRRLRAICACAAAFVGASAFASGWTWSGKTGDVTITAADSPVDIADADVATVNALSSLTIESGAIVNLQNTSSELSFGATPRLLGAGRINGAARAKAAFSGDARGFTGVLNFVQSWITVTSEWGLGEATVYFDGGSYGSSTARLRFSGAGTNCHATVTVKGWTDNAAQQLTAADETVTFEKAFTVQESASQYFNGAVFNGKFTAGSGNLAFQAGKTVVFNGSIALRNMYQGKNFWVNAGAKVYINGTGNQWGDAGPRFCGPGTIYFGADNAMDGSRAFCTLTSGSGQTPTIDLQGHSQTCTYVCNYDAPENIAAGNFPTFTSSMPATLTMGANGSYGAVVKFSGQVSHRHTGTGTYTMHRCYSDTTGTLEVSAGAVKLDSDAGWGGDVRLSGNGRLIMTSGTTLNVDGNSSLNIGAGSVVELPEGYTIYCNELVYDGQQQSDGVYSGEEFVPTGRIVVVANKWTGGGSGWSDPDNWTKGCPGAGDVVIVPSGAVVEVGDADKTIVESLDEIVVFGELRFVNVSAPIALAARLSGSGTVSGASASGGIVLSGDNREHSGSMTFSGTPVTVAGRYALGAPFREVYSNARLLFRGAGLTNDVPLRIEGDRTTSNTDFTEGSDRLVLNGDVVLVVGTASSGLTIRLSNIDFNGNVSLSGTKGFVAYVTGISYFNGTFNAGRQNRYIWELDSEDAEVHMKKRDGNWANMVVLGPGKYVCEGEDALSWDRDLVFGISWPLGYSGHVDLNGYTQQARNLRTQYTNNTTYVVTSLEPAQLMLTMAWEDAPGVGRAVSFKGKAGLGFGAPLGGSASSGELHLSKVVSDTTGLLSTTNGTVVYLESGAAWYGDILADGDGSKIVFDSVATLNPNGTSTVTVGNGGKIQIDGRRIRAGKFIVNGVDKGPGAYNAANCPAAISGTGSLVVPGGLMLILK